MRKEWEEADPAGSLQVGGDRGHVPVGVDQSRHGRAGGRPRVVFSFTVTGGKIAEIALLADPERLRPLDLAILGS